MDYFNCKSISHSECKNHKVIPAMKARRYFGRDSMSSVIYEIYRIPANGRRFHEQDTWAVERLRRDGTWKADPNDKAIWAELLKGDFAENCDEITAEKVNELFELWSRTKWPGRPDPK